MFNLRHSCFFLLAWRWQPNRIACSIQHAWKTQYTSMFLKSGAEINIYSLGFLATTKDLSIWMGNCCQMHSLLHDRGKALINSMWLSQEFQAKSNSSSLALKSFSQRKELIIPSYLEPEKEYMQVIMSCSFPPLFLVSCTRKLEAAGISGQISS